MKSKLGGKPSICIGELITGVQKTFASLYSMNMNPDGKDFDYLFKVNEEFKIGNLNAKALHIPGHTPYTFASW